jgi:hypothetical protein
MRWEKGQSDQPVGPPKGHGELRELARQHTEGAIATLVNICRNGENEGAHCRGNCYPRLWLASRPSQSFLRSTGAISLYFGFWGRRSPHHFAIARLATAVVMSMEPKRWSADPRLGRQSRLASGRKPIMDYNPTIKLSIWGMMIATALAVAAPTRAQRLVQTDYGSKIDTSSCEPGMPGCNPIGDLADFANQMDTQLNLFSSFTNAGYVATTLPW